ncbi:hypothetical protein IWQ62_001709 [Dispira parvispora]|uniref:Uncharacterized protein n=1 Tax=Dispira parvispora TaxID=1520584 RepID=A0A9W8E890_9FUNG|nr:hypothetical protein IWQ62_001709 [Dispira parvispora]
MKSVIFTFGIISATLVQAQGTKRYSSTLDSWEHRLKYDLTGQDSIANYFIETVRNHIEEKRYLLNSNWNIRLKPWCGDVLDQLTLQEKQSKMDLYVKLLCEDGNDSDEPGKSVWRVLAAFTDVSPEKLVPYAKPMLNHWGYMMHKNYQAITSRTAPSMEEQYELEQWLSDPDPTESDMDFEEGDSPLDEYQARSNLYFPKGQFAQVVHPMSDNQFQVQWTRILEIPDIDLLRLSPYLLMLKHGKYLTVRYLYLYIWGALRQVDLIKGPHSVMDPVAKSYPLYFDTGLDMLGNQVDWWESVWNMNYHDLLEITSVSFSLATPILSNDYKMLEKILQVHTNEADRTTDEDKKGIALLLYSMTQQFFPQAQEMVSQTLIGFLGEPAFKRMKYLFFNKKNRGNDQEFKHVLVEMLRDLVRVGEDGQLEIAIVDIVGKNRERRSLISVQ